MRPKTFPAAPYVGNTRQRLLEIKEGLKQPAKLMSQALHGGSSRGEGGRGGDCKGKDQAGRQQQLRQPQKFTNYQNALREIRKSLLPFANESGPASGSAHASGDVNRQMLQELVKAGCEQVRCLFECVHGFVSVFFQDTNVPSLWKRKKKLYLNVFFLNWKHFCLVTKDMIWTMESLLYTVLCKSHRPLCQQFKAINLRREGINAKEESVK